MEKTRLFTKDKKVNSPKLNLPKDDWGHQRMD